MKIIAIVAMAENRVIGNDGQIPWHLPQDLKRFSKLTTGNTVLMGRKTYQSLPEKFRPLPNRKNVVATRNPDGFECPSEVEVVDSPVKFLNAFKEGKRDILGDSLWIIGGADIYKEGLPFCDEIYLTRVDGEYDGDVYFPEFEVRFKLLSREELEDHSFEIYKRKEQ